MRLTFIIDIGKMINKFNSNLPTYGAQYFESKEGMCVFVRISVLDKPVLLGDQFVDDVIGYKVYYNPMGYGGVTVVDNESYQLIKLCDGIHSVEQIYEFCGRSLETVLHEIQDLADQEVITISDQFTKELHLKHKKSRKMSCWLHITNNCNLTCSYCYIHKSPGNMSLAKGKLVVDKMVESCRIHNMHALEIKFAGGEPLLRFDFIQEIVTYSQRFIDEIEISYTLVTNGMLVTPEISRYLKKHGIGIGVSLDGIGPINDLTRFDRNGHGSYKKVLEGLRLLKDYDNRVSIMTTISKSNYDHLLDLVKFLLENEYRFRLSLQKDCETGWPELINYCPGLIENLHLCYDYIEANLPKGNFFSFHKFGDVTFMRPVSRCCNAGNGFFAAGHDGTLGICGMGLDKPLPLTLESCNDVLDEIKSCSPLFCHNTAYVYPKCNECIWRTSCAGGCPLQNEVSISLHNRETPYCQVYKEILPRILRIKGLQMIRDFGLNT